MDKIRNLGLKIKENFKNNKVPFLICMVIWIVAVVVTINIYSPVLGKKSSGNPYHAFLEYTNYEINEESTIIQEIPTENEINALAICFSTFSRENKGKLFIEVSGNNSGHIYAKESVSVSNIQDNAFYFFDLDEQLDTIKDTRLIIKLSSNSKVGQGVGVPVTEYQMIKDTKLVIKDETIEGVDLIVRYLEDSTSGYIFYEVVSKPLIIGFTLIIVLLFLFSAKLEYVFASLALIMGLLYTFVLTPYSIPDELHHYILVHQATNYLEGNKTVDVDYAYIKMDEFEAHYNLGKGYRKIVQEIDEEFVLKDSYYPISHLTEQGYYAYYVPQIIGVYLTKKLNMNYYGVFYSGRIMNVLFYTLCVFIAIRKTPIHKTLFGIIACLPVFIQQAASYSYDSFINALSLITIAYFLKWLLEDKKIEKHDYIICFITCLGLAPAKYVYGFFALLFWLVPTKRFGSLKNKIVFTSILCLPMLYVLVPILGPRFLSLFKSVFVNIVHAEEAETQEIQMYTFNYCLAHPKEVISIVLYTIRYNIKAWFYGAIGRYLSGLTITLPLRMVHILLAILLGSMLVKEDYIPSLFVKGCSLAICTIMGLFTIGGMLLYWTTTADTFIQGIQGRYFSPMIPYVSIALNNKKVNLPKWINKYLLFAFLLLSYEIMMYVIAVTYIN